MTGATVGAGEPPPSARHRYGPRVHVLGDAYTLTALARLGSPDVTHTELLALLRALYEGLAQRAFGTELSTIDGSVPTRMAALHGAAGVYRGPLLDPGAPVVVVDVIRGGILPAQVCFETLTRVLPGDGVRLDHVNVSRVADRDGRVVGADLSGSKVGGSTLGATLVIPDPMGATGSTVRRVVAHLVEEHGRPARILCLPLIATPEFLRAVLDCDPNVAVYCLRVDRGLSPPDVLATVPGTYWERERGLDERGYVVPGAGGVGEVLNKSWC